MNNISFLTLDWSFYLMFYRLFKQLVYDKADITCGIILIHMNFVCFSILLCSYEQPDIALNCGTMLRESIRHEALAKIILESPEFYKFFDYVELATFDIASDAFSTFKVRNTCFILWYQDILDTMITGYFVIQIEI